MTRIPLLSRPRFGAIAVGLATGLVAIAAAACSNGDPIPTIESGTDGPASETPVASDTATEPASTSTTVRPGGSPSATATGTAEATEEPTATTEVDPLAQLRPALLSSLTIGLDPGSVGAALDEIEVVALELPTEDRDLWVAVTSGSGIYDLPEPREHVLGVYERVGASWVELANVTLSSGPTYAELELLAAQYAGASWIAVNGQTGAHSGTFELLRFDGVALTSAIWWFSSTPAAATIEDLDGVEPPEVVLNATDPYVYCYACGVRAWQEVIYRWVDGQLAEVPLGPVTNDSQVVRDTTEVAAIYAQADLWQDALDAASEALALAPDNEDVWWLHQLIERVASDRLGDAGSDPQPFVTNVLAGEYEDAVDLMRPYLPEVALAADGPLIAATVAEGETTGATATWVLDYTERALKVEPDRAAAHAARAFGLLLDNPEDWSGALAEMETALRLEPQDDFYREAVEYLFEQNGNAFG
ncbi:MAG: hypothetical protein M0R75_08535 [Dehalococcoidia bacterium]|nr:hypothetical protein [Dehalococcoidia bacterium]